MPTIEDYALIGDDEPRTDGAVDGVESGEGVSLACLFRVADALAVQGKLDEARQLFERQLDLGNDVGLSEESDPTSHGQLGNFPQAFTHLALVSTALVSGRGRGMRHARTGSTPQSGQGNCGLMAQAMNLRRHPGRA
jgi:hypothetical protein